LPEEKHDNMLPECKYDRVLPEECIIIYCLKKNTTVFCYLVAGTSSTRWQQCIAIFCYSILVDVSCCCLPLSSSNDCQHFAVLGCTFRSQFL